uniref:Pirin n=1 Tax=Cyprinus carpio TaxID=7962 RepID=A0A8C2Q1G5_CYPCA
GSSSQKIQGNSYGITAHEDFCGHSGNLKPGDLQVEHLVEHNIGHPSRGVIHAEMPVSDGCIHGFQLWVNLKSQKIPKPSKDGVTVNVISGEALGVKVGVKAQATDLRAVLYFFQYFNYSISFSGWTAFIYTLAGSLCTGPDDDLQTTEPHHSVVLEDGECVRVENKSHFVLIAGEDLFIYLFSGPFFMSTKEDYRSATKDWSKVLKFT